MFEIHQLDQEVLVHCAQLRKQLSRVFKLMLARLWSQSRKSDQGKSVNQRAASKWQFEILIDSHDWYISLLYTEVYIHFLYIQDSV